MIEELAVEWREPRQSWDRRPPMPDHYLRGSYWELVLEYFALSFVQPLLSSILL